MFRDLVARRANRRNDVVAACTVAVVEALEHRQLLSTVTFAVDPTATAIYLTQGANHGEVRVRYGSPTSTVIHTFTGATDTDEITSASSGVTFYQQVPAAAAPDGGITVSAGSGGTLEIDAGPSDEIMTVTATTSTSGTVQVTDTTNLDPATDAKANDYYGSGISNLTLRTNDKVASTFYSGSTQLATDGAFVSVPNLAAATHLAVYTGLSTHTQVILGGGDNSNVTDAAVFTGAGHDSIVVTANDGSDTDGVSTASIDFGTGTGWG
jgi:hypothetical protein